MTITIEVEVPDRPGLRPIDGERATIKVKLHEVDEDYERVLYMVYGHVAFPIQQEVAK